MARAPGSNSPDKPPDHELMLKSGRWKEAVQAYLATITYLANCDGEQALGSASGTVISGTGDAPRR